jgi:hypothetical protein
LITLRCYRANGGRDRVHVPSFEAALFDNRSEDRFGSNVDVTRSNGDVSFTPNKQTSADRFGSNVDVTRSNGDVSFTPNKQTSAGGF